MRRLACAFAVPAAAVVAALAGQGTAAAAENGEVTVFSTEFNSLSVYENPSGCHKLPLDGHVLVNRTDKPVTLYGDPFCMTPGMTVQPDHGAHVVPGTGSFSA